MKTRTRDQMSEIGDRKAALRRPSSVRRLPSPAFWRGKRVLVTGHTGFKGSWLSMWLNELGAEVHGYALNPPTEPSLYESARVGRLMKSDTRADILDVAALCKCFEDKQPEIVFHLAAQPLVRESYRHPVQTWDVNLKGTINVLEAARVGPDLKACVFVTTDKVYKDLQSIQPHKEEDALGGHDPYSASKAAAELAVASYRRSFLSSDIGVQIATARSGNVIGGGDWGFERLVPDCLKAYDKRSAVVLRYPDAVRPWQYVLESLCGYILLAERLATKDGSAFAKAWNFGPDAADSVSVKEIAERMALLWGDGASVVTEERTELHESMNLLLDSTMAREQLLWQPSWNMDQALDAAVSWFKAWRACADMRQYSINQLTKYLACP